MNKEEFITKYCDCKKRVDAVFNEVDSLERDYIESNSPIKASMENPVLCEVEITSTHINHRDRVKEVITEHDEKYLVGYNLCRPFTMTEKGINPDEWTKDTNLGFVFPVFRKVKKDGSMSRNTDRIFNAFLVDTESIVFWEKGKPEKKYLCDYKNEIKRVMGTDA